MRPPFTFGSKGGKPKNEWERVARGAANAFFHERAALLNANKAKQSDSGRKYLAQVADVNRHASAAATSWAHAATALLRALLVE